MAAKYNTQQKKVADIMYIVLNLLYRGDKLKIKGKLLHLYSTVYIKGLIYIAKICDDSRSKRSEKIDNELRMI